MSAVVSSDPRIQKIRVTKDQIIADLMDGPGHHRPIGMVLEVVGSHAGPGPRRRRPGSAGRRRLSGARSRPVKKLPVGERLTRANCDVLLIPPGEDGKKAAPITTPMAMVWTRSPPRTPFGPISIAAAAARRRPGNPMEAATSRRRPVMYQWWPETRPARPSSCGRITAPAG